MKHELKLVLFMAVLLFALTVMAAIVIHNANAEELPSPNASNLLDLTGGLKISDAPIGLYVAKCLRVDVVSAEADGVAAELKLPLILSDIIGVALFDGWNLIYGAYGQANKTTLKLKFWPNDIEKLENATSIYLVILAKR